MKSFLPRLLLAASLTGAVSFVATIPAQAVDLTARQPGDLRKFLDGHQLARGLGMIGALCA